MGATMNENDLKKAFNFSFFPGDSKLTTSKVFVKADNVSMGGTYWACFYIKYIKS